MTIALVILFGYLLGSCPWAYWLPKLVKHEDIRQSGSGNIGASNVWRTYGTGLGVPVILLDALKGFVPTLLGILLVGYVCGIAAGAAAMIGHWRPLFLGFQRGGKMVATGGGAFFALAPLVSLTAIVVWLAFFIAFRYASVASLAAAAFMPIGAWAYGYPAPAIFFGVAAFVAVLALHRKNLTRLWSRTENRSRIEILGRLRASRT